ALVLVCSVLGDNVGVLLTAVVFAAIGAAWLARRTDRQHPLPWGALAAVALLAGGVGWIVHGGAVTSLASLLPNVVDSSGGDESGDQLARSGLGDGPDQQAGPTGDAGFDRSDFFCETDGQCLYDAFVETYGEPPRITKQDKVEWLHLEEEQIASHRERDLRNGRQQEMQRSFDLRRRKRASHEHSADAVLWIEADRGQFPVRLPVLAFDHYHGGHWHEEADQAVMSAMDNAGEDLWFQPVDQPTGGVWGDVQTASISTGNYDGNVLPMPGGMTRFRMGQSTRADLFASAAEPMLRVNRRRLPEGSILDVQYRPAVQNLLQNVEFARTDVDQSHLHPMAAKLAKEWAGDLPRGWPQVQAIVDGLREYATHDPDLATTTDEHEHGCPVEVFLHDTRRGDAHLFASAVVLMLQSLDYDTRLAGGYYADADDIDAASGKAVVQRRNAHVWPQVRLAAEAGVTSSRGSASGIARGGQWIDLEPTPGFAVADGLPTFAQKASALWSSLLASAADA
ncbi:MAG: transglutaminase domain-containing protein, partial [Planctomycetota bacterium]